EVGELPLAMRVKLLRAIQERGTKPVGGKQEKPVEVRIVSITNANIADLIKAGTISHDLYYRLNVIEQRVPDLKERREDIAKLANYFLDRLNEENETAITISREGMSELGGHPFPGNIRELENMIERAYTL